ncbi:polyphosphate--glucose phosphotransferase [Specibacter sp. NPDC057265]|uniref:polyphosphate--glucose phosphotransferase n=1 Tax=Specibacter sp. NPDC057265 TaxID=3346075 RepID=UPI0036371471
MAPPRPPASGWPAHSIGIDIGGTSIKGGRVNTENGQLTTALTAVPTPQPATPLAVTNAIHQLLQDLDPSQTALGSRLPLGVAAPAIMQQGIARSAANISDSWIGMDVNQFMTEQLGRPVSAINDADAAGLAEVQFGAGKLSKGLVVVITLGTGIGSALVMDGTLVPNTEFGHLEIDGQDAEVTTSAVARERNAMGWPDYARHLNRYLSHLEFLLSPELIIIGGGISARSADFLPLLKLKTKVIPAKLQNAAGTIGAATHMLTPDRPDVGVRR